MGHSGAPGDTRLLRTAARLLSPRPSSSRLPAESSRGPPAAASAPTRRGVPQEPRPLRFPSFAQPAAATAPFSRRSQQRRHLFPPPATDKLLHVAPLQPHHLAGSRGQRRAEPHRAAGRCRQPDGRTPCLTHRGARGRLLLLLLRRRSGCCCRWAQRGPPRAGGGPGRAGIRRLERPGAPHSWAPRCCVSTASSRRVAARLRDGDSRRAPFWGPRTRPEGAVAAAVAAAPAEGGSEGEGRVPLLGRRRRLFPRRRSSPTAADVLELPDSRNSSSRSSSGGGGAAAAAAASSPCSAPSVLPSCFLVGSQSGPSPAPSARQSAVPGPPPRTNLRTSHPPQQPGPQRWRLPADTAWPLPPSRGRKGGPAPAAAKAAVAAAGALSAPAPAPPPNLPPQQQRLPRVSLPPSLPPSQRTDFPHLPRPRVEWRCFDPAQEPSPFPPALAFHRASYPGSWPRLLPPRQQQQRFRLHRRRKGSVAKFIQRRCLQLLLPPLSPPGCSALLAIVPAADRAVSRAGHLLASESFVVSAPCGELPYSGHRLYLSVTLQQFLPTSDASPLLWTRRAGGTEKWARLAGPTCPRRRKASLLPLPTAHTTFSMYSPLSPPAHSSYGRLLLGGKVLRNHSTSSDSS
ncbi:serine/arginine repetitive matrix protein 1-like [Hemicordylus capensis]|uniref:serine/arginine repetitive matrix protein 1-like n=1 Tax=Hemicordylus capensis TaxID=884348 RepID=UPI002302AD9A|nr:serine/arginine repetitive matrix protein 1-like [Hemicordylus capensis]